MLAVFSVNLSGIMSQNASATSNFFTDECGTVNDTYTVPGVPNSKERYLVNNVPASAGTTPNATGTVTIAYQTKVALWWVTWSSQSHTFTNVPCPTVPTFTDACGTANDIAVIPQTHAQNNPYIYWLDLGSVDVPLINGTYPGTGSGTVKAKDALLRTIDSWQYSFSTNNCATASIPTVLVDDCGVANDTYFIPATAGVIYKDGNGNVVSGTVSAGGASSVTITAEAAPGYILQGAASWTLTFNTNICVDNAFPSPDKDDECEVANDAFTLNPVTGVIYKDSNGNLLATGTPINANGASSVTVTAEALAGYELTGPTTHTYDFTDVSCANIKAVAVCDQAGVIVTLTNDGDTDGTAEVNNTSVTVPAKSNVSVTVPYNLFKAFVVVKDNNQQPLIDKEFNCTPGMGGAGGGNSQGSSDDKTDGISLPQTGSNSPNTFVALATIVTSGILAYGATFFLANRRNLSNK